VLETGVEPVRMVSPTDFKSVVSACSTTRAKIAALLFYNRT
jgi:hypothetical protein